MKKNFKLLLLVGLAVSIGFTSCTEDEETTPTPTPSYGEITLITANMRVRNNPTDAAGNSFLATSTASTHTVTEATANQSKIDLVLYFGGSSGDSITLAAPSDGVFTNADNINPWEQIKTWTTKNATVAKRVPNVTFSAFATAANDSLIIANATSLSSTRITKLQVGEIVAFQTAAGKKGMYYITNISGADGNTRNIDVLVKIQK